MYDPQVHNSACLFLKLPIPTYYPIVSDLRNCKQLLTLNKGLTFRQPYDILITNPIREWIFQEKSFFATQLLQSSCVAFFVETEVKLWNRHL